MKCNFCPKEYKTQNQLIEHIYTECIKPEYISSLYNFDTILCGSKIYENEDGGNIYIIQKDELFSNYYKIGMTKDLEKRYSQYKSGNIKLPIIHYYYPFRNIRKIDGLLKNKLKFYNHQNEIFKCDDLKKIRDVIKNLQLEEDNGIIEICPKLNIDFKKTNVNIENNDFFDFIKIKNKKELIADESIENKIVEDKLIENTNTKYNLNENKTVEDELVENEIIEDELIENTIPEDKLIENKKINNECCICNKIYSSYKNLWRHNKQFHTKKENEFKCNFCSNIYKHSQSKNRHEKTCLEK